MVGRITVSEEGGKGRGVGVGGDVATTPTATVPVDGDAIKTLESSCPSSSSHRCRGRRGWEETWEWHGSCESLTEIGSIH
jgi:hypothetical protein